MVASPHPATQLLADLVTRDDDAIDLPAAALAIARIHYPDLDPAPHLASLRRLGQEAAEHVDRCDGDRLTELSRAFHAELGFRGNSQNYDDPRNSFLNDVLARRCGLPITLSVVYIELGQACGIPCAGIGFPGHFLVREKKGGRIVDPFHKGRLLSEDDCRRLLERQGLPSERWSDEFLAVARKCDILARMLNNLHRYYSSAGDEARLRVVAEMLTRLRTARQDGGGLIH